MLYFDVAKIYNIHLEKIKTKPPSYFKGIFRVTSIKQWPQKSTLGASLSLKLSQYVGLD